MVDVQPHYFGGLIDRVDLVIDHHPEQPGYTAVFKDIRADYGSTSHDPHRAPARRRREHLRAHRDGDALRDQVRHAVLQPADQPRRPRGVLVSLSAGRRRADPQDGRRGNHARAARLRDEGAPGRRARSSRCSARSSAPSPREDFIPYVADFFLQLEDVKWTIVAGIVNDSLVDLGAESRLLEERRRVRAPLLRRHRQRRRPSRDGEGGRADARRSARSSASSTPTASPRGCRSWRRSSCTTDARADKKREPARREELTFDKPRLRQVECPASEPERSATLADESISRAPDRDRRSGRRHLRARPTAATSPRHAGLLQLLVGVAVLRRQHRQADEALDAAEARRALDDLQPIEEPRGALVLARRDRSVTMPPKPVIWRFAIS